MVQHRLRGYLLIEMATAVAVLAILAAVARPDIRPLDDLQAAASAARIATVLRDARAAAQASGIVHGVDIDLVANSARVFSTDITVSPLDLSATATDPVSKLTYRLLPGQAGLAARADLIATGKPFNYVGAGGQDAVLFDGQGLPFWYKPQTATRYFLAGSDINVVVGRSRYTVALDALTGRVRVP
ncbi:MAG: hypothetical protein AB7Q81_20725 [Gammaproteobacteria bacterium]